MPSCFAAHVWCLKRLPSRPLVNRILFASGSAGVDIAPAAFAAGHTPLNGKEHRQEFAGARPAHVSLKTGIVGVKKWSGKRVPKSRPKSVMHNSWFPRHSLRVVFSIQLFTRDFFETLLDECVTAVLDTDAIPQAACQKFFVVLAVAISFQVHVLHRGCEQSFAQVLAAAAPLAWPEACGSALLRPDVVAYVCPRKASVWNMATTSADWPEWIDNDTVDSMAMLGAFLATPGIKDEPYYGKLRMELHIDVEDVEPYPSPAYVYAPCSTPIEECNRCRDKRGGYKFRWYSKKWALKYMEIARKAPNGWVPPACDLTAETDAGTSV